MVNSRAILEARIDRLEQSRRRSNAKFLDMIAHTQFQLANLSGGELEPAPPTRPAVPLPSPSTPPDAPSLEDAPELARYVPTAEILALSDAADVLTTLGKLATPREEHELLSAWTVAGNRAALTAVAVHVGGSLGERAARALKRLGSVDLLETA